MNEPVWILRTALDAIHELLIAEHGGAPGLRDEGLLDSALARPRHMFAYGETDPCALAAGYAVGIARNHPFIDGNKRSAFMAAFVFLMENGLTLTAEEAEASRFFYEIAAGAIAEPQVAEWFRQNTSARSS